MSLGRIIYLFSLFSTVGGCWPGTFGSWHAWGSCSRSCGGGTRSRVKYSCVRSDEKWQHEKCNEFCYNRGSYYGGNCHCNRWRSGTCCEDCVNIDIPHCKTGRQQCGGSPDNIKCTECSNPYYSAGWGNGCHECPDIAECVDRHCTTRYNTRCDKCQNNGILFKPTPDKKKCERVCAWDKQNCWPGHCVDDLTRKCYCAPGFHKYSGPGETSCQLDEDNAPSVSKCFTSVFGPGGKGKQTKSSNCKEVKDFYGNFQPRQLRYDVTADFKIDISNISNKTFIKESTFGVTNFSVYISKELISGTHHEILKKNVLKDISNGTNAVEAYYKNDTVDLNVTLNDGERLCVKYEAYGGGYLTTIDISGKHEEKGPYPYRKTNDSQTFCYRYDKSKPHHCLVTKNCSVGMSEPLRISNVISRSKTVTLEFNGWTDPVPVLGKAEHASGIESYLITIHEVSGGIPDISSKITKALNFSQTTLTITLPPDSPRLYCIKLEVKDVAENTQQARRFVLYDNSTFISANAGNASFSVTSATGTNKWQTNHGDICLSWKSYFTNTKYEQNTFLEPIVSDNLISKVYDQTTGSLSVSGTKNVFGIVKYLFSWSLNNGALSKERRVPDFTSQTYCQHFNMKDGQTYTLKIRAVDIVNNTYSENRTVYIDRTPPHIQNIGLMKNGMRQLFVHGNTDLSKLNLSFEALDPHSGLLNIQWWIGTSDSGSELGHGIRSAQKISQDGCPKNMQNCYCPDVGQCEGYGYNIPMNGLAHNNTSMGNHNRNYFFTIKVTNNAGLSNTEHVDILVDDSPPEHGVIYEGAKGTSDIDYTSDGSFIVRWHGFIDHESGIKEYRLGLANTCVGKEELENYHGSSNITQYAKLPSTESSFRMTANFTGKKYVNIIAINNAMEASDIVCSDGITRDDTPPVLENLRIQHGTWYESLYCRDGEAWLFKSDLMKVRLPNISECNLRCKADTPGFDIYEILPVRDQTPSDETFGEFMCRKLPMYDLGTIIYLPNDRISLSWEIEETGSQIEDFFVSFGLSSGNVSAPSIMNYKSTNGKMFFKMRHLGVGTGDLFYAYIKTVNKAKLAKVTEIGPILIDETPPYFNGKPVVLIDNHMVTVGWNKNTVYDPEQAMQINQMFFQIVHDAQVVSPFLEWRLEDSWPCVNYTGGCITYPVEKLQKLDTDLGLNFTILVYAYNNAGHFATMKTDTFKVPSLYPPGQAVVNDIDPEGNSSKSCRDTDVHFTANTLCAQWTGFRHHENVKLEIGVGTNNLTADLVQFHPTNASNRACIKSKALQYNTKYFVLLRASCSGGETVSSSNGISIVNETHFLLNFEIQVGVYSEEIRLTRAALNSSQTTFCVSKTVKIGQKYKLMIKGVERNISGTTHDHTVLYEIRFDNNSKNIEVNMIPLIERPCITLDIDSSCNATAVMYRRTDNGTTIIPDSNAISVAWAYRRYKEILKHLTFEISLGEREKLNSSQLSSITDVSKSYGFASHTFHDFSLLQGHVYAAIVKPCTNFRCIGPVYSDNFEIESTITPGKMLTFQVELNNKKTCVDVTLSWKMFEAKSSVTLYQWSLSKDKEANIVLTRWRTVACDGRVLYNVSECVNLPVLGHATIYLCVRAFSAAGNTVTSCKRASLIQTSEISRDILYDIDASVHSWNDIKKMIHSSNIGHKYSILHNAEMDFGITNTSVVGTLMYATDRNVTWYLMKNKHLPVLDQCDKDSDCIQSATTDNGYVMYDKTVISKYVFYYTCAFSNTTSVTRELFTEELKEIRSCSNGFIIDDTPPSGGQVRVKNTGGFVTSSWKIDIFWNGFDDNIDTNALGYADRIKFYSYAIGTRPGGEDITRYTVVGNTQQAFVRNLDIEDGTTVYVSVKATDQAGLSTEVHSDELTIDSTPPVSGKIIINGNTRGTTYISSSSYEIVLSGFSDDQSNIDYFELSIGTDNNLEDIQYGLKYTTNHLQLQLLDGMRDGHHHYISVKAVNRAGLSSLPVTASFIPDRSAPTGGHVLDGDFRFEKDLDYQKDLGYIQGHWKGFTDSHSGIKYYRVGLGTQPDQDDIETFVDVGLRTDITWNGTYEVGKKYYVTVAACNGAGLCRSISSDGIILDNSQPIHGVVKVGSVEQHQKYIPTGETVLIRWFGFEDPQSGIDHYEYCIGSKPLLCDVLSFSSILLESSVMKNGLNLTNGKMFYATVNAFNKAGMSVGTASDAFAVDNTPPVLVRKPSFLPDYNSVSGLAQRDRTVLRLSWKFIDAESKVASHTITLKTHHEGHTPVEHIHIGNVDNLTISLSDKYWLNNGDKYFVVVTSCNTAGLCTTGESDSLLIDSTPPHQGGFKPPLTWNNFLDASHRIRSKITLTWYGFVDAESPLNTYYLTVSRNYSGHELSGGVFSKTPEKVQMEQNTTLILAEALVPDEPLILSIWAENLAGMNSSVSKLTASVLLSEKKLSFSSSGLLEIQKHSCDVHYCNKDCTCAVYGKPCVEVQTNRNCATLNITYIKTMKLPEVDVFGGLLGSPQDITASSSCLSGHWIPRGEDHLIQRYEWSMGIKDQPVGEGVFDLKSERPWKDVGKRKETVYCVSRYPGLQHNIDYQIYVRAWYSSDKFAEFMSFPIRIDHTPPHQAKGKYIKDSDATCSQDLDVIDWMESVTACWDKVFTEAQGKITHYIISLGTSINGSDIYGSTDVGIVERLTLTNLSLSHGTQYYFTITAYNTVGLHTTLSSDGFIIDMDRPISGVVFNTDKHKGINYQSSETTFGISWHGFLDHHSGIKSYSAAVVENSVLDFENISFLDVGLKNRYTFYNITLQNGKSYKGLVKAVDKAGHISDIVSSSPKFIDVTAPTSFECENYQTESLNSALVFALDTVSFSRKISRNNYYVISGDFSDDSISILPTLSINRHHMHLPIVINDNGSLEFKYGFLSSFSGIAQFKISAVETSLLNKNFSIHVEMSDCIIGKGNRTSKGVEIRQIGPSRLGVDIKVRDGESSLYKVRLGVGTSPGGFQISPMTVLHSVSSNIMEVDVHHGTHIFATVLAENHAGLQSVFKSKPVTFDKTPPMISTIEGKLTSNLHELNQTIKTFTLLARWTVADQESGVKYCLCGLGKLKDETDLERYRLSDTNEKCTFQQVALKHGDNVYVSVKCTNNVELTAENVSEKIMLSIKAPEITHANIRFISPDSINVDGFHQFENKSKVSDTATFIQKDRSHLLLEWTGFKDITGINYYEYRLMCINSTIVDWKSNDRHTVAELNGLDLHSGDIYTAEVRAVNFGQYASTPIISDVLVHGEEPKLTGKPVSVTSRNQRLFLDWSEIFSLRDDVAITYDVIVGSKLGYSDILELKNIGKNRYEVTVPGTTVITPSVKELFISITCTYSTGLYTLYQFNYKL